MLVVEIIGNLGADATIKDFNGQEFIAFNVAHTESFTDGQGQRRERTVWVSCLKHGRTGVFDYLKRGTRVFVRGELSANVYQGSDGHQVGLNCRVRELQLLGGSRAVETQTDPATQHQVTTTSQPDNKLFDNGDTPDDLPF